MHLFFFSCKSDKIPRLRPIHPPSKFHGDLFGSFCVILQKTSVLPLWQRWYKKLWEIWRTCLCVCLFQPSWRWWCICLTSTLNVSCQPALLGKHEKLKQDNIHLVWTAWITIRLTSRCDQQPLWLATMLKHQVVFLQKLIVSFVFLRELSQVWSEWGQKISPKKLVSWQHAVQG